jgi:FkbM family methyltransferase
MRLLREILDDSERVFFDIGANIGSYTLLASEQPARIFAFEPHPVTFQLLEKNVKRNGRSNVKLYRLALGSENRDSFLTDYRENCINRIVKSSEKYSIKICCMRGDSLIRDTGVIPEIVKIDTEGHEHEVLNGMGDYLVQVDLLFVEITKHRDAVLEILLENGLRGPYSLAFSRKVFFPASGEPQEDEVFLSDREICRLSKKGYRFQ